MLAGATVAEMLSDLVRMQLHIMFEEGDGLADIRVPMPDPLLIALAERHRAEFDLTEICRDALQASAFLLDPNALGGIHEGVSEVAVTTVLQPELSSALSDDPGL